MTRCALIVYNDRGMVLIEHPLGRSKKPGNWDLPKGHFDPTLDFKAVDVAIRECEEETGLVFDRDEVDFLCQTKYGSDTLYVFAVSHPTDVAIEQLHCSSMIDERCSQKWKIGLPEVDDYDMVPITELGKYVFKKFDVGNIVTCFKCNY